MTQREGAALTAAAPRATFGSKFNLRSPTLLHPRTCTPPLVLQDKDVFLRELVSNAADACDKRRFLALTDGQVRRHTFHVIVFSPPPGRHLPARGAIASGEHE